MVGLFILSIVLALLCAVFGFAYKPDDKKSSSWVLGVLFVLCVLAASASGDKLWGEKPIKPIDVYRGKTTLEITYKDSVAIDSVVVWK